MNNRTKVFYATALLLVAACNAEPITPKKRFNSHSIADTSKLQKATKKFAGIRFASKRDTICGMPITAGLEDTLVLKRKVYGFCAIECKEAFIKILKAQHKR